MSERTYTELKGMLCDELEQIVSRGSITAGDLEAVHKLTDTIKNVYKIEMYSEGENSSYDGYSNYNGGSRGSYGGYNGSRGRSYGNYSNDGGNGGTSMRGRHYVRGHYSYADGSSMLEEKINEMMMDSRLSMEDKNTLKRAMDIISK